MLKPWDAPKYYDDEGRVIDAQGHPFDPVGASSPDEFNSYLMSFGSYDRTEALAIAMVCTQHRSPDLCLQLFLRWGNLGDAPWAYRSWLSNILRDICVKSSLSDLLEPEDRTFYDSLPALVPVWRGCQRKRERGMSWSTDRKVAEGFAWGKRCINNKPTLVSAIIPKQHIFAVFAGKESEIAVDYKRLRKLREETPLSKPWWEIRHDQSRPRGAA